MTKLSASTLSRMAAKTKNKAAAKQLRAQAAKLRRDRRVADAAGLAELRADLGDQKIKRALASADHMPLTAMVNQEQPGRGEIVGGYLSRKAEEITKLARKKGGIDAIQMLLRGMQATARDDATGDANHRVQEAARKSNEQWRDNIVTGFMARMQGLEQMHRNGLPSIVIVDGVTLARVVDALAAAGYTSAGKR